MPFKCIIYSYWVWSSWWGQPGTSRNISRSGASNPGPKKILYGKREPVGPPGKNFEKKTFRSSRPSKDCRFLMHLAQDFLKKNFCSFSSHFPIKLFLGTGIRCPRSWNLRGSAGKPYPGTLGLELLKESFFQILPRWPYWFPFPI